MSEIWPYMYFGLQVNYTLFLSHFNGTWIFSTDFWKILKYQILLKSSNGSRVVSCGQTDVTELIVAFRNFAKAPNQLTLHLSFAQPLPTDPAIQNCCSIAKVRRGRAAMAGSRCILLVVRILIRRYLCCALW